MELGDWLKAHIRPHLHSHANLRIYPEHLEMNARETFILKGLTSEEGTKAIMLCARRGEMITEELAAFLMNAMTRVRSGKIRTQSESKKFIRDNFPPPKQEVLYAAAHLALDRPFDPAKTRIEAMDCARNILDAKAGKRIALAYLCEMINGAMPQQKKEEKK